MKSKLPYLLFIISLIFGSSCELLEEEERYISFFTDVQIDSASTFALFINDKYVDDIHRLPTETSCGDSLLVKVPIVDKKDMNIQVIGVEDEVIELGYVNLHSAGNGLKIKPTTDSSLFVKHDLDSPCTLIRLRW